MEKDIFEIIETIKSQYCEGLIDKTDMLDSMVKHVGDEVLKNAKENRDKARRADRIVKKFADGTEIKLYWSDELGNFVTIPED